jgi:hypothetical protein
MTDSQERSQTPPLLEWKRTLHFSGSLAFLEDPEIARALTELIPPARDRLLNAPGEFDIELHARRSELIEIETKVTRGLGATESDITRMYLSYQHTREGRETFPEEIDALKRRLVAVHTSTKLEITASRELSRKEKKARKRKIGQGIASAIFGTGVIVADTQMPLLFAFSYGLGGGALHQAIRDIVGEAPD